jgi:Ni,Fe-hydrogenase I large subunit
MSVEGDITVRLDCGEGRVRSVSILSSRAGLPPRFVHGRAPRDVERLVPLVFSVCGRAQGAAASCALAAAQGISSNAEQARRQQLDVTLETLQETAWRLLIDWPKAMDEEPSVPPVAAVRRAVNAVIDNGVSLDAMLAVTDTVLAEHVYGQPAEAWLAADSLAALDDWIERAATMPAHLLRRLRDEAPGLGASRVALMPEATRDSLNRSLLRELALDPYYARAPRWAGLPAETGALARQAAHPLLAQLVKREGRTAATRFIARLVELARLVDELRQRSGGNRPMVRQHALEDGVGIGLAETARGLLLHRAQVIAERVADYRIVAPTEWNFHPNGPLPQGLVGRNADDRARLEREARTVVQSLDPCVACRVEIADA